MIKNWLYGFLVRIYPRLFAGAAFYGMNRLLFELSLRGLGILNCRDFRISGEESFVRTVIAALDSPVVMDVGANKGEFSNLLSRYCAHARIFAFEPHPGSFQVLRDEALRHGYTAVNVGLGGVEERARLYNYAGESADSVHASLYREVLEEIHLAACVDTSVSITTLDAFLKEHSIPRVHFLKIDTEGSEFAVLEGAKASLESGKIDIIQVEFNEMNVISKVFFRDFQKILHNYDAYRMLPRSLARLSGYRSVFVEIFAFQNLVFVRKGVRLDRSVGS